MVRNDIRYVSKHDEIINYLNILDASRDSIYDDILNLLAELGEDPNDYTTGAIRIEPGSFLKDQSITSKIRNLLSPVDNVPEDTLATVMVEDIIASYIVCKFVNSNAIDYIPGAMTRGILRAVTETLGVYGNFERRTIRYYRKLIEDWVADTLNPVLDALFDKYQDARGDTYIFFSNARFKLNRYLEISFVTKRKERTI
jgi:hypothetical protein